MSMFETVTFELSLLSVPLGWPKSFRWQPPISLCTSVTLLQPFISVGSHSDSWMCTDGFWINVIYEFKRTSLSIPCILHWTIWILASCGLFLHCVHCVSMSGINGWSENRRLFLTKHRLWSFMSFIFSFAIFSANFLANYLTTLLLLFNFFYSSKRS